MYKKVLLITSILIISGCAEKIDFTKGVSEEDKKLYSSTSEGWLHLYKKRIIITKNGFYPYDRDRYKTKVADYLNVRKFNLGLFISDIKYNNLEELRTRLISVSNKYNFPKIKRLTLKEIETIESKKISLHEKQKILVNYDEEYIKKISNPSKELKKIVRLNQEKRLCNSKPYDGGHYSWNGSSCEFNPRVEPSTPDYSYESDNSGSSGGYSSPEPIRSNPYDKLYRDGVGYRYDDGTPVL
jgi:hypothetical protein